MDRKISWESSGNDRKQNIITGCIVKFQAQKQVTWASEFVNRTMQEIVRWKWHFLVRSRGACIWGMDVPTLIWRCLDWAHPFRDFLWDLLDDIALDLIISIHHMYTPHLLRWIWKTKTTQAAEGYSGCLRLLVVLAAFGDFSAEVLSQH